MQWTELNKFSIYVSPIVVDLVKDISPNVSILGFNFSIITTLNTLNTDSQINKWHGNCSKSKFYSIKYGYLITMLFN